MSELATAIGSDEMDRVTTTTDEIEDVCARLDESAHAWGEKKQDLSRRRAAIAAGDEAERNKYLDSLSDFARRLLTGSSHGKRPSPPDESPIAASVITHVFDAAEEKAGLLAEEARALRSRGEELARAMDLTGVTVALSELLEANAPLVKRFRELREAAGLVARDVNPVVLDATLDVWRPVFEALLGSRHGSDVDGRLLALGWLHRAGVELPDHIAEIDEGKKRIDLARGDAGGDRIDSAVIAWKAAAFDFLKGDHRG